MTLTPYGYALRMRWAAERAACRVLGHRLPRPIPGSRVVGFAGVLLCACDRCGQGVRVVEASP